MIGLNSCLTSNATKSDNGYTQYRKQSDSLYYLAKKENWQGKIILNEFKQQQFKAIELIDSIETLDKRNKELQDNVFELQNQILESITNEKVKQELKHRTDSIIQDSIYRSFHESYALKNIWNKDSISIFSNDSLETLMNTSTQKLNNYGRSFITELVSWQNKHPYATVHIHSQDPLLGARLLYQLISEFKANPEQIIFSINPQMKRPNGFTFSYNIESLTKSITALMSMEEQRMGLLNLR